MKSGDNWKGLVESWDDSEKGDRPYSQTAGFQL